MPTDLESDLASLTSTKEGDNGRGRRVPKLSGNELEDQAPIWKLYKKAAAHRDSRILRTWNSSIDTLLIFAALFSAVVTAFIIESYKLMQPDYAELTFKLLASNTEHPVAGAPFRVSASARSVNCLWITSLVFSLSTSLVGILIKQWLADYDTMVQEESMLSCAMRQNRYDSLVRWRLPEIVSWLPVLLHASLFLFLAGLVIFLFPLDPSTASLGLMLTVLVSSSYSAATLLPIIWVDSPYATPVTSQLARLFAYCRKLYPEGWPRVFAQSYYVDSWHKSLACAFEWLVNTAPSTVSDKICNEVQKALSDLYDGPYLCHHLPHIVQMATDRLHYRLSKVDIMGQYVADTDSDSDSNLHLAFRLAFNLAEFSYRKARSQNELTDIMRWYRFNRMDRIDSPASIESPASIVALCYLRERSTHEAIYHDLEVPVFGSLRDVLQRLPVSSETVLFIAKYLTRSPRDSPWSAEQRPSEYQNTLRGLDNVLTVLCAWRNLFDWDAPVVWALLSSWVPHEARESWGQYHSIPALCRIIISKRELFRGSFGDGIYYDPTSLVELLQHLCLARLRSPDVGRVQYSEVVDVLGSVGDPFFRLFEGAFSHKFSWTTDHVEAFLDAALIDPSNAACAQMVRNVLGLDVCIDAPRVRDRCAHIVLELLKAQHSDVVQRLFDSRALAMLRDHTRITEIVVALFETLIRWWHYPKLDACFDLDDMIPAGGRCTPNVIATAIRQRYSDDRASELRDICGMVISLAEWGCFEGSGKAIVDAVWKDLVRDEASGHGLDASEHVDTPGADSERDDIMGEFFIAMRGAETCRLDRERFNHSQVAHTPGHMTSEYHLLTVPPPPPSSPPPPTDAWNEWPVLTPSRLPLVSTSSGGPRRLPLPPPPSVSCTLPCCASFTPLTSP